VELGDRSGGWTIVPVPDATHARAVPVRGWHGVDFPGTHWEQFEDGYELEAEVEVPDLPAGGMDVRVGVIVNETAPGRARRRGQLVLGGRAGEWVYLRGDRHDRDRLLPIRLLPGEVS